MSKNKGEMEMKEVHDNDSAFIKNENKYFMAKVSLPFKPS